MEFGFSDLHSDHLSDVPGAVPVFLLQSPDCHLQQHCSLTLGLFPELNGTLYFVDLQVPANTLPGSTATALMEVREADCLDGELPSPARDHSADDLCGDL